MCTHKCMCIYFCNGTKSISCLFLIRYMILLLVNKLYIIILEDTMEDIELNSNTIFYSFVVNVKTFDKRFQYFG